MANESIRAAFERMWQHTVAKIEDEVAGLDGGGAAIIDVIELPTENIREDCFYRLLTGTFVYNQYMQNGYVCHCVNGLPETGEPATNATMSTVVMYYNTQDGEVYGYVDAMLSQGVGIPIGWHLTSMLFQAAGWTYSGVITDILDDPRDNTYRLLLEHVSYYHKDEKWTSHKTIGWAGDGRGAEVFNHPSNKAYGYVSHAEGRFTVAGVEGVESYGAHAEGWDTKALADASHAEGRATTASGEASHAEGHLAYALGNYSHAEGTDTVARGWASHAEGNATIATGECQHVAGAWNIEDTEDKYAHIVGNGDGNNRSNAHTLDWDGNAWFAGDVYIGGESQDDPNAKRLSALVLPDPDDGGIDGRALVNQNGAWEFSDAPVATMAALSNVSAVATAAHDRIDTLETQIGPIETALDNILEIQQSLIDSALPQAEGVEF